MIDKSTLLTSLSRFLYDCKNIFCEKSLIVETEYSIPDDMWVISLENLTKIKNALDKGIPVVIKVINGTTVDNNTVIGTTYSTISAFNDRDGVYFTIAFGEGQGNFSTINVVADINDAGILKTLS